MAIALTIIFCLAPIALTIHLAVQQDKSRDYKKKLAYIYGGIWAIAFLGCGWLYFQ